MRWRDLGNDDDFHTAWLSNPTVKAPWYEIDLDRERPFNLIVITEAEGSGAGEGAGVQGNIKGYRLEYRSNGVWKPLVSGDRAGRVKVNRFPRIWGDVVRILIDSFNTPPGIAELGVYDERR